MQSSADVQRHGMVPTTDDLNEVIEEYAKKGQTSEVARLIQDFEAGELSIDCTLKLTYSWPAAHRLPPRYGHQVVVGP